MREALAADGPVVLVVDDLHWAEPGLVTVLEAVCHASRDAPILVAVIARPEFLDIHPSWGPGRTNAVAALLEPLRDNEVDALTSGALGGVLPADAANRVREAAGGNPLFVEQLLAMLVEDGGLVFEGDGWVLRGDASSVQIPPTITALLEARLDRLSAQERALLASAAVIGQVFYRAAVTELSLVTSEQVSAQLRALVRKGLVRPATSDLPGQEAFRAIESLNARCRRAITVKGQFPTEQAALKTLYPVTPIPGPPRASGRHDGSLGGSRPSTHSP